MKNSQIQQIKDKLLLAKQIDSNLNVFGAASHRYSIHPPASIEEVEAFEERYDIQLPECYKSFVLEIGNGGSSYLNSGAGPYYGIYPLSQNLDDLIFKNVGHHLKKECMLYPNMTETQWSKLTDPLYEDDINDEDFAELNGTLYGGILPIGSQGCSYIHALVLNGAYSGKVINMDRGEQMTPHFSHGENFLDWYEQWLDEIISGKLIRNSTGWFGYPKD